ncbi:MAG: sugar transferase [Bacilli bacterium]|nr:sugar transferase [Bacilli bacterium]
MYRRFFKRFFDLIVVILFFPFFGLIFLFLGLAIVIDNRGPIIYSSKRLGKNGKIFNMYKFRSMKVNAPDIRNSDGSTYNSENDPRVTRLGRFLRKTSIDELPQIVNVLKGDMSLIGPRPDLDSQVDFYDLKNETKFKVRPGLTGYAQVHGRNLVNWEDKVKLDRIYVEKLTFGMDFKIFFKTIKIVLFAEGVNKNEK